MHIIDAPALVPNPIPLPGAPPPLPPMGMFFCTSSWLKQLNIFFVVTIYMSIGAPPLTAPLPIGVPLPIGAPPPLGAASSLGIKYIIIPY